MEKSKILKKLSELRELQRRMEDLAAELGVGDIREDKIYISILAYRSSLEIIIREDINLNSKGE